MSSWSIMMNSIIATALSGLDAARKRLEVSAANVANVASDGALPDPTAEPVAPQAYVPLDVSQRPLASGGTVATIRPRDTAIARRYAPDARYADLHGMVASPNVDLVTEGINRMAAARAYEANAHVARIGLDLERATLDALASRRDRLDLRA
jgi:flagellar basal-body rod protein FlgC